MKQPMTILSTIQYATCTSPSGDFQREEWLLSSNTVATSISQLENAAIFGDPYSYILTESGEVHNIPVDVAITTTTSPFSQDQGARAKGNG